MMTMFRGRSAAAEGVARPQAASRTRATTIAVSVRTQRRGPISCSPLSRSSRGLGFASRPLRRPLVDALQRSAHQRGLLARRQTIGVAERVDPLPVRQQPDCTGPVGTPQAALEAEGVEDPPQRIPDVLVGIGLA